MGNGLTTSCKVRVNADGDWHITPPAGQITRIGSAIGGFVPPVTNKDFLVAGHSGAFGVIVAGSGFQCEADSEDIGAISFAGMANVTGETVAMKMRSEEITIPIGSGALGVVSTANIFQPSSVVVMVYARVTQAPGGGATWFSVVRTGTPADELILQQPVALDGVFDSTKDSDGTHDGPFYNGTIATLKIITDANVTGTDMKIRVGISHIQLWNFDS